MIKALIGGSVVTYGENGWETDDKSLMEVLPLYESNYWDVDGSYTPDRELAIMQYVLEITGGRITYHVPPEYKKDLIY